MPAQILNHIALHIANPIGIDELDWLDLELFIVVAVNLNIECIGCIVHNYLVIMISKEKPDSISLTLGYNSISKDYHIIILHAAPLWFFSRRRHSDG